MADELDKFVLQYTVEMKDAIERLEKLNQKVEGVAKTAKASKSGIQDFATGAADELGKIVPGVDKVSGAFKLLSGEFVAATVAVGVLAAGVKAVINLREQFNAQRQQGMDSGISSIRLEDYQRKMQRLGGGYTTREMTATNVQRVSDLYGEAYRDVTRIGPQARTLRQLGLDPGPVGGKPTSTNDALVQLATKFQTMKPEQVQGIAKNIGLDPNFALTLQKIGPQIGKITDLTLDEVKARASAQTELDKFNSSMATLEEKTKKAGNELAENLLPALTRLIDIVGKIVDKIPNVVKDSTDKTGKASNGLTNVFTDFVKDAAHPKSRWGIAGDLFDALMAPSKKIEAKKEAEKKAATPAGKSAAQKQSEAADKFVQGLDTSNKEGNETKNEFAAIINMFAGAVASFANAVDERQAWAAWAGEIGKASGLSAMNPAQSFTPGGGSSVNTGIANVPPDVATAIHRASAATGVSEDILKRIGYVESHYKSDAVSEKGAVGIMQIMPSNFKSLGITDGKNIDQNVLGGAKLYKEYLEAAKGDQRRALMMYHGGYKESGWGEKTRSYPDKVLGTGTPIARTGGESMATMQLKSVQDTIAGRLGVPVKQLQLGGVSRGDVQWAERQLKAGISNNIAIAQAGLNKTGMTLSQRSKIMTEIQQQQIGLQALNKYGGAVANSAPAGSRDITIGEIPIQMVFNGAPDPQATGKQVVDSLQTHLDELSNAAADGISH